MKNNKGFTLIELILIVAMLLIVVLMFSSNFSGLEASQTRKAEERFQNNIQVAVSAYISSTPSVANEIEHGKGYSKVSIYKLIEEGFLDKKIIDPQTDEKIDRSQSALVRLNCDGEFNITFPLIGESSNISFVESTPLVVKSIPTNNYQDINTIAFRMLTEQGSQITLTSSSTLTNAGQIKFISSDFSLTNPGTYKMLYNYLDNTMMCRQHVREVIIY